MLASQTGILKHIPIALEPNVSEGEEQRLVAEENVEGAGIGASFGMTVLNDTTTAAIGEGAAVTGAGNVALTATTSSEAVTFAQNGTQGKLAITPTVAVTIANVNTDADIGAPGSGAAEALDISGALSATATQTASVETKARGNFESSSAGIGASIAISSIEDEVSATTHRNLDAGGTITFEAIQTSSTSSPSRSAGHGAEAGGAEAGKEKGPSGNVQEQAQQQLNGANGAASHNGANGAVDKTLPEASNSEQSGSGSIQAAAAISYNLVHASALASLPEGLKIVSGGLLTLSSKANTHASANAGTEAEGKGGGAAIAASVAINRVYAFNEANVTAGDVISSSGLLLSAVMNPVISETGGEKQENTTHEFEAFAEAGASESETINLTGSLALNIIDVNTSAQALAANANTKRGPPTLGANGGSVTMTAESKVSSKTQGRYEKHIFDPNEPGEIVGLEGSTIAEHVFIRLPQELEYENKALETGDPVVYYDAGESPIGISLLDPRVYSKEELEALIKEKGKPKTLEDGKTYYAIVGRSGYVALASSKENAEHFLPLLLEPKLATGKEHRLETPGNGGKIGVGAAISINLVTETTSAGIAEAVEVNEAEAVELSATASDALITESSGGAAGGKLALSPTVSVSIPVVTTTAYIASGPALSVAGKITASASQSAELHSIARGQFVGKKVGIGISLSLIVPTYTVEATAARNLTATAGEIALQATGSTNLSSISYAAGSGESETEGGSKTPSIQQKSDKDLQSAQTMQKSNGGKTSSTTETPEPSTGEGGGALTLAGAVTISIVDTTSLADFANATTVEAGGQVSLKTAADTTVLGFAKGDTASTATVGIAAGVTINDVSIVNRASTGGATVHADGIHVEAVVPTVEFSPTSRLYIPQDTVFPPEWVGINAAPVLPLAPENDEYFELTEKSGFREPGVYKWHLFTLSPLEFVFAPPKASENGNCRKSRPRKSCPCRRTNCQKARSTAWARTRSPLSPSPAPAPAKRRSPDRSR